MTIRRRTARSFTRGTPNQSVSRTDCVIFRSFQLRSHIYVFVRKRFRMISQADSRLFVTDVRTSEISLTKIFVKRGIFILPHMTNVCNFNRYLAYETGNLSSKCIDTRILQQRFVFRFVRQKQICHCA